MSEQRTREEGHLAEMKPDSLPYHLACCGVGMELEALKLGVREALRDIGIEILFHTFYLRELVSSLFHVSA
jgi:hypothetical protein